MILGIDVSTYLEQQKLSHPIYTKDGQPIDPFKIFKNNGVTHIRTRIWNDPYDKDGKPYLAGTCDLDNFINLFKHLKPYDFKYVVDFHYSDFWCDPSKQYLPKEWVKLSFDELLTAVYLFTRDSLMKIKEAGVDVTHVQTGNEITHGMLWPHGKLQYDENEEASWSRFTSLLRQGIKGVKEVYPNAEIIIHLEQSYDQGLYGYFIEQLRKYNVPFDILGSSYYPFWHHGFDEYFANQDMVINKYHVKAMNCEVGYPFTTLDYREDEDGKPKHLVINADNIEEFKKMLPYPDSKEGQALFVRDFIRLSKEHHLEGVFYWEPLWIPGEGICWASKEGQIYQNDTAKDTRNEWANQCMFDYNGEVNPSVDEYKL